MHVQPKEPSICVSIRAYAYATIRNLVQEGSATSTSLVSVCTNCQCGLGSGLKKQEAELVEAMKGNPN